MEGSHCMQFANMPTQSHVIGTGFGGLGVFKGWEGIRAEWGKICPMKQCLPLRNLRFIHFNKNLKNAKRDWTSDEPSPSESSHYLFLRFFCTFLLLSIKKKKSVLKIISRIHMTQGLCKSQSVFTEQLHRGKDCFDFAWRKVEAECSQWRAEFWELKSSQNFPSRWRQIWVCTAVLLESPLVWRTGLPCANSQLRGALGILRVGMGSPWGFGPLQQKSYLKHLFLLYIHVNQRLPWIPPSK